jgi:hypothetical protein
LVIGYGYAPQADIERYGPLLAKALMAELARLTKVSSARTGKASPR